MKLKTKYCVTNTRMLSNVQIQELVEKINKINAVVFAWPSITQFEKVFFQTLFSMVRNKCINKKLKVIPLKKGY